MIKLTPGRIPGPILTTSAHHLRGSLSFLPQIVAVKSSSATLTKKLDMVPPASDQKTKEVKSVQWKLYSKKQPHWEDPQQSSILMGCALASILCALANTRVGDRHIKGMIKTVPFNNKKSSVSVEVNLKKGVVNQLASNPGSVMKTHRYFSVTLGGKSYDVSDVFYTDESTNVLMIYMESPNNALWPCVIEKAYAKYLNKRGYTVFENLADPEQVWMDIVGTKPSRLQLSKATNGQIIKVLMDSKNTPTIAVTTSHGYAVRNKSSNKGDMKDIKLYDTWIRQESTMDLHEFKQKFTDLFYAKP